LEEIVMLILGKLVLIDTQTMEHSMPIPQETPWPPIDLVGTPLRDSVRFL
jgi:hypothetical protein